MIVASSEDDSTKLKPNTINHRVRSRECRLIPSFHTKGEGWGCERKEKKAKKIQSTRYLYVGWNITLVIGALCPVKSYLQGETEI